MDSSPAEYHHTQIGYTMLVGMSLGVVVLAAAGANAMRAMPSGTPRTVGLTILGVVILMIVSAAVTFSSLTVDVREGQLAWHFTGKIIRGSASISEVESASVAKNSPAYGWGIRETPYGRLYNVSGLHAVRVRLRDGTQFSLGTNDPERLAAAITGEVAKGETR
jgi:hypothetical protein